MEFELEQETFSKMIYILIGVVVLIAFVFILDVIFFGGNVFVRNTACLLVWFNPINILPGYLGCQAIPF